MNMKKTGSVNPAQILNHFIEGEGTIQESGGLIPRESQRVLK